MSSLSLDFTNSLAEAIGATHGLTKAEVDTLVAKFPKHHENVDDLRTSGQCAFFDLPYQDTTDLKATIKKHQGKWDNLLIVGTGGSTLAARSVLHALGHGAFNHVDAKERKGAPRVFFLDNPDPRHVHDVVEVLDLKKTLVMIISKSGISVETNAILLWLAEQLKKKAGKSALSTNLIFVTDKEKSPLNDIAKQEKIPVMHIPPNLPGRYGILGNASLFMAGLCGFDWESLLVGAAEMDKRCRHGDAFKNPAYMHSLVHYLLTRKRRKTIHVTFSFSNRLHAVGEWYSHLCAVSLGKMLNRKGKAVHVGPSPVASLGSYDQHGQMQLFAEGPFDKVVTFLTAKDHGTQIVSPAAWPKVDGIGYLGGTDWNTILDHGYWGAEQHITAAGRPNMTVAIDTLNEQALGGLYYMLQLSTTMSAELYGIDPFDQPGVEHNKHASFALFGRPGFEDLAKRIKDYQSKPRRRC